MKVNCTCARVSNLEIFLCGVGWEEKSIDLAHTGTDCFQGFLKKIIGTRARIRVTQIHALNNHLRNSGMVVGVCCKTKSIN